MNICNNNKKHAISMHNKMIQYKKKLQQENDQLKCSHIFPCTQCSGISTYVKGHD